MLVIIVNCDISVSYVHVSRTGQEPSSDTIKSHFPEISSERTNKQTESYNVQ